MLEASDLEAKAVRSEVDRGERRGRQANACGKHGADCRVAGRARGVEGVEQARQAVPLAGARQAAGDLRAQQRIAMNGAGDHDAQHRRLV
jgi:hypothetical protein